MFTDVLDKTTAKGMTYLTNGEVAWRYGTHNWNALTQEDRKLLDEAYGIEKNRPSDYFELLEAEGTAQAEWVNEELHRTARRLYHYEEGCLI